jgi:hypothetical protein
MKRSIFILLLGSMAHASGSLDLQPGMACGNTDDANGIWLNKYMIPDQFPFDAALANWVTAGLLPDYQKAKTTCPKYGFAKWANSCYEHDRCMESIGLYGQTSTNCNDNVLQGWKQACADAYALTWQEQGEGCTGWDCMSYSQSAVEKSYCATECMNMAQGAHDIMAGGTSSFGVAPKIILDINGDRTKDAVLFPKTNRMYIDLGQKQNAFQIFPGHTIQTPEYFKVGDFNGDHKDDLVELVPGFPAFIYSGNASGNFDVNKFQVRSGEVAPWDRDMVVVNGGGMMIYGFDPANFYVRDFNHDGISDIMNYFPLKGYVLIWYGSRTGIFTGKKIFTYKGPDTYSEPNPFPFAAVFNLLLN